MRSRRAAIWLAIVPSSACLSEETRAYRAPRIVLCLVILNFLPFGGARVVTVCLLGKLDAWFAELVGRENVIAGTDCGLGGRVHPQIAWAKLRALRNGAAIASKKLWS